VKVEGAGTVPREDAVQRQSVGMEVQIEGSPKPLDHSHRSPTTIRDAAVARAGAKEAEHRATQLVVPRQLIPQTVGQTQDPLSRGHT